MTASARGLFKATGGKRKLRPTRLPDGTIVKTDTRERHPDDFEATPPEATLALLHAERKRLRRVKTIWEPAAGGGDMVRPIEQCGFNVFASDLVDRGCFAEIRSFYDYAEAPSRTLITNPPFNECNWRDGRARWIYHAMETLGVDYMALLLSWSWPAAAGLATLWHKHPPKRVYLMRWKPDFSGEGAPPMNCGWFVWDKRARNKDPRLLMLDRKDARQGELL